MAFGIENDPEFVSLHKYEQIGMKNIAGVVWEVEAGTLAEKGSRRVSVP